jgi:hypothetical protein
LASLATAGIGQKWSFAEVSPNVGFLIIKRSSGRIVAAQNHLVAGYVGFEISKRKKWANSDFVAF